MAYIEFNHIVKAYGSGEASIRALDDASFSVEKGELAVILGSSGAGKTTALNILGGMDVPTSGQILVDGNDITKYSKKQLIGYRRTDIGFVFQFYNLVPNLTALENVELAAQVCKDSLNASEMLDKVGPVSYTHLANEIAQMEKENIICGYHTMINWENTSEEKVIALIEVRVTPQRGMGFDKLAERIYRYEEVETVYLMSGGYDFTVILDGKTLREVSRFVSEKLATLDSVLSTATHFVLKKYKEHGTILAEKPKDERMLVTP